MLSHGSGYVPPALLSMRECHPESSNRAPVCRAPVHTSRITFGRGDSRECRP
jgi:hypothetical protein